MSTDLERFRDHCRTMSLPGAHLDGCRIVKRGRWGAQTIHPDPACPGCVPAPDRVLFAHLATEVDTHLTRHQDTPMEIP